MAPIGKIVVWLLICSPCYYGSSGVNNPSKSLTANSPSLNDIKKAISNANPGDTVIVPAGTATWSSQLEITKGILLIGNGIGNTVITSNYTAASNGNPADALIYYHQSPSVNAPFKISGFSWELANKCMFIYLENLTTTPLTKTRIDHNYIHNSKGRTIINNGTVYGVIDNNTFDTTALVLSSYGLNETSWTYLTFAFGTADNMYFEDNAVTSNNVPHDGGAGGRYCARYNTYTYTDNTTLWPWVDFHGNGQGPGANHAMMGVEIYENKWSSTQGRGLLIADARGGRSLVYNNVATTTTGAFLRYREEFIDTANLPAFSPDGEPQHVNCSYMWGNTDGTNLVTPDIEATVDYSVGQTFTGLSGQVLTYPPASPYRVVPQFDLDCWKQVSPFTGSTGMGVGLFSAMPSSCTLEGAAYWATDQNLLYRWHNGAWQLYYTPYTYPHPLRSVL